MLKVLVKFEWGHPQQGCQMHVGYAKIRDVRQITLYNSKTVQDRCHHQMTLPMTLIDQITPFYTLSVAFRVKGRNYKYGKDADHNKS